ncbi:MAG: hypothetical protein H9W81_15330 [Enterococcus sp.]|nr:hypothetical protein [Enterococcus sp.]
MRATKKTITKPNKERIRYSITEMTEEEYKTICKALELMPDDKEAASMLHTFKSIAEN